jgi:ADP-ribose pyrophosphatase YjhB (NUDIX family)
MQVSTDQQNSQVLTEGVWEDGTPWKFITTIESPPVDLCTAVFCVTTYQGKIILTENGKRGWEIPGGHREEGENLEEAVKREIREETGAIIGHLEQFGLKVISPKAPVTNRNGKFYPYPHSYVPYYFAEATEILEVPLADDITGMKLVGLNEARNLLMNGANNDILIDHLQKTAQIALSD